MRGQIVLSVAATSSGVIAGALLLPFIHHHGVLLGTVLAVNAGCIFGIASAALVYFLARRNYPREVLVVMIKRRHPVGEVVMPVIDPTSPTERL